MHTHLRLIQKALPPVSRSLRLCQSERRERRGGGPGSRAASIPFWLELHREAGLIIIKTRTT